MAFNDMQVSRLSAEVPEFVPRSLTDFPPSFPSHEVTLSDQAEVHLTVNDKKSSRLPARQVSPVGADSLTSATLCSHGQGYSLSGQLRLSTPNFRSTEMPSSCSSTSSTMPGLLDMHWSSQLTTSLSSCVPSETTVSGEDDFSAVVTFQIRHPLANAVKQAIQVSSPALAPTSAPTLKSPTSSKTSTSHRSLSFDAPTFIPSRQLQNTLVTSPAEVASHDRNLTLGRAKASAQLLQPAPASSRLSPAALTFSPSASLPAGSTSEAPRSFLRIPDASGLSPAAPPFQPSLGHTFITHVQASSGPEMCMKPALMQANKTSTSLSPAAPPFSPANSTFSEAGIVEPQRIPSAGSGLSNYDMTGQTSSIKASESPPHNVSLKEVEVLVKLAKGLQTSGLLEMSPSASDDQSAGGSSSREQGPGQGQSSMRGVERLRLALLHHLAKQTHLPSLEDASKIAASLAEKSLPDSSVGQIVRLESGENEVQAEAHSPRQLERSSSVPSASGGPAAGGKQKSSSVSGSPGHTAVIGTEMKTSAQEGVQGAHALDTSPKQEQPRLSAAAKEFVPLKAKVHGRSNAWSPFSSIPIESPAPELLPSPLALLSTAAQEQDPQLVSSDLLPGNERNSFGMGIPEVAEPALPDSLLPEWTSTPFSITQSRSMALQDNLAMVSLLGGGIDRSPFNLWGREAGLSSRSWRLSVFEEVSKRGGGGVERPEPSGLLALSDRQLEDVLNWSELEVKSPELPEIDSLLPPDLLDPSPPKSRRPSAGSSRYAPGSLLSRDSHVLSCAIGGEG